ncbi:bifunctional ADP-dependent NAD(P)H-hydrate dehydratase/NAD(P)H-hydrate epimerase [Niabella aurantiaca]|uniref:bifunctional ADP-dependent NAD(P)H-hydrate dehydratase/NAD(P)H-hydrate epimerase n=1 Tax=Niabella aurantiaca TaxID=379900 RepID=UPI00037CDE24|nr:bifunctional ADP-dependent NAD(P)H-hydrate dehydratase/NAD(P)H-hydrate epimerase [Niabella aurantiaca]
MKLLNAAQIRQWDEFTMQYEPVVSLELMERAANACARWLQQNTLADSYYVFCGKGNNGGDGLAIARLLYNSGKAVTVFILESEAKGSEDYISNFNILHHLSAIPIYQLRSEQDFPLIPDACIIVDALFGTGLNRGLTGRAALLVDHLNNAPAPTVSIDMPSGLFCDQSSLNQPVIRARHTLTFQVLKMAFLAAENEAFFGQVHLIDINLHPAFPERVDTRFHLINKTMARQLYRPRTAFAHKGNFGHALIVAGSYGKTGAAVLSTRACLRAGAGLVSAHVPEQSVPILQTAAPEAMLLPDTEATHIAHPNYAPDLFSAIGVGPGIGTAIKTKSFLRELLERETRRLVLDADALNIIGENPGLLNLLRPDSILTPHPKEFARLFGTQDHNFKKIEVAVSKAMELNIIIVLKGHHTLVALPDGTGFFNISGNAGMAKGGSGDVLTGILTGLLAQGYLPKEAAIMGVFLHGLAGDLAAQNKGMDAMLATDIIENIGNAFQQLS